MNRIIGAFTFRRDVYSEVEHDAGFTNSAWVLVVVASFLGQLGANAADGFNDPVGWTLATTIGTLFAIAAFIIGAAALGGFLG